jgi:Septum formation
MSRSLPRIALVVVVVTAIVIVAFAVLRGSGAGGAPPESLAVGDCFDVPTAASIATIPVRPCDATHAGEVFHVFEASADSAAYPSDPEWGQLIYPVCDPAFETYTGSPVATTTEIDYSYLVPTAERWSGGDRRVVCFIVSHDGSPLVRSYRNAG